MAHPGGRPTKYTPELVDRICQIVATHPVGLPKICKMFPDLPHPDTIRCWRWEKTEFSARYAEAKRFQAEIMAESLEDITDDLLDFSYEDEDGVRRIDSGMVARARIIADSRKWTASKLAPKIYGDKQQVEQVTSENDQLKAELAELRAKLADKSKAEY